MKNLVKPILALLVVVMFSTTVLAEEIPWQDEWSNGKPFQQLWDAVNYLYTMMLEIELTPGPEGPRCLG